MWHWGWGYLLGSQFLEAACVTQFGRTRVLRTASAAFALAKIFQHLALREGDDNLGFFQRLRIDFHSEMFRNQSPKACNVQPGLLGLIGEERARADPEFRERFEIFLVSAGDRVFLSAFDSKAVFSRRKRPDFFHERGVHEHRSVDADESMGFEPFCHHRNRLT
jgi:hypothetical protein